MSTGILRGRGKEIESSSEKAWRAELEEAVSSPSPRLRFMTKEHHLVRDHVVRELPRRSAPVSKAHIADVTGLSESRVQELFEELEARLFFLVRNAEGAVSWAYPVTVEPTPHRLRFRSGERLFAA